jgi:uncharacterized surface protein with fasciclin (FAS1) repeats
MRSLKSRALGAAAMLFVVVGATACSKDTNAEMAKTEAAAPPMMAAEQPSVMVGGAAMYPTKNIVENAVNSADHTTLVAAVQAAGLVETLSGPGPFTVLAPVNAAFDALPAGTVETLLKPENKAMLSTILACHVIPAKALSTDIMSMVEADGGKHVVDTVGGCRLTLEAKDGKVTVTDENGTVANVTIADVIQSNGVIHVIDAVLTPKSAM